MFRHSFTIALRNIIKFWKYSLINILGLAIGMASFIFIALYIEDELSYDKFHRNADRIYRVNRLYNANGVLEDAATLSFPEGPALAESFPGYIEKQARLFNNLRNNTLFQYTAPNGLLIKYIEPWFYLADTEIFDIFTFTFLEGDPKRVFDNPTSLVISRSAAQRYFGDRSPIGEKLRLEEVFDFTITGVFEDLPSQSHMKLEIIIPITAFQHLGANPVLLNSWVWNPCWTYLLLHEGSDPKQLSTHFEEFVRTHYFDFTNQDITLYLQKLTDIHLRSKHVYEMRPNSNIIYVNILSAIAFIVLILACINYMNLATASSAGRAKEIAIKKLFGGVKLQLIIQFLSEAIVQTIAALIISLLIVELLLPAFNEFTSKEISSRIFVEPLRLLMLMGLAVTVGLFAGMYPAFFLSSFKPMRILTGRLKSGVKSGIARKMLVVGQFAVSIALITGTLIVFAQLKYIRQADLGFRKDKVIVFRSPGRFFGKYDQFKQELLENSMISHVTGSEDVIGIKHNTRPYRIEELDPVQNYWLPAFLVDWDFVETFDIEVVAGRAFSRDYPDDPRNAVMINETMARDMGWTNEEAIGKSVRSNVGNEKVIGVFKDYNAMSLHYPVNNFILDMTTNRENSTEVISVRFNTDNFMDVIKFIEGKWNEYHPSRPFEYQVLGAEINDLYRDDVKFGKFSLMLTLLAIIIAAMGLTGLTSFLAEQKTKEIGIRKVLGASTWSIVWLMFNEFIVLLLISNIIAWPVTYFAASKWLDSYSRHTVIHYSHFIFAALMTMFLALVITGYRAIRTSRMNPASTLKYE